MLGVCEGLPEGVDPPLPSGFVGGGGAGVRQGVVGGGDALLRAARGRGEARGCVGPVLILLLLLNGCLQRGGLTPPPHVPLPCSLFPVTHCLLPVPLA